MARTKKKVEEVKEKNDKERNISVNMIEKCADENYVDKTTVSIYGNEITVNTILSFDDMVSFVDGVVSSCFDSKTGQYMPEIKEFVTKMNVINFYTNITLPMNIQKKYEIIYKIYDDVWGNICDKINGRQHEDIMNSIDDKISHILNSKSSDIISRVNYVCESSEQILKKMEELFSVMSKEEVSAVMHAFAQNGGIVDESKITEKVLEYMEKKDA